jgi:hypothetical protein
MKTGALNIVGQFYAGTWQLVEDKQFTEATTSYTFSGLHGDTDEEYRVVGFFVNPYAGSTSYFIRPNNDTGSNYGYQYVRGINTATSAARSTATGMVLTTTSNQNEKCLGELILKAKSGIVRTAINMYVAGVNGTTVLEAGIVGHSWNNTSNEITSLAVTATNANGIGAGSRVLLFKRTLSGSEATMGLKFNSLNVKGKVNAGVMQKIYEIDLDTTNTNYVNDDPTAAMLSASGLGEFNATQCVDNNTETVAFNTNAASAGAYVLVDLGAGVAKPYTKFRIYISDTDSAQWNIQYSDNGSSWANAVSAWSYGGVGWREVTWNYVGAHRYWRMLLQNAPGGSANVREIEFYTSGLTSLTISGLHGNTDVLYEGWARIVNSYAGDVAYYLRPNGDTGANCGGQALYGSNTTVGAFRTTGSYWRFTNPGSQNQVNFCHFLIFAPTGFPRVAIIEEISGISGTTVGTTAFWGDVWSEGTNSNEITSLVLAGQRGANEYGIGTHIELWALRAK